MGTTADKMTYLNETKAQIRQAINDLGEDVTDSEDTFRSYVEALEGIYNSLPKVTGSGESVTLENTKVARMETEIGGNSKQDSTSISGGDEYDSPSPEHTQEIKSVGDKKVNLIDYITMVNGQLNNDGTVTSVQYRLVSDFIEVTPSMTYYMKWKYTLENTYLIYSEYDENKNHIGRIVTGGSPRDFTTSATTKYIKVCLSRSTNALFDINDLSEVMLSEEDLPYIPYGQGCANVTVCNENLISINANNWQQGSILSDGTENSATNRIKSKFIKVNNNQQYVIKFFNKQQNAFLNIHYYNSKKEWITHEVAIRGTSGIGAGVETLQFTPPEDTSFCRITLCKTNYTEDITPSVAETTNLFLIKGTTAPTEYVEHQEQTFIIPTQQPFRKIGDYKDLFFKNVPNTENYNSELEDNVWYEKHFIGEVIYDGTQGTISKPSENRFNIDDAITNYMKETDNISYLANIYIGYPQSSSNSNFNTLVQNVNYGFNFSTSAYSFTIRIKDTRYNDISTFANNLQNNPLIIDYVLAEPTYIECTEEQTQILEALYKAKSYNGQTNVFSIDKISPIFECSALKDLTEEN